jgi:hypothetical protein
MKSQLSATFSKIEIFCYNSTRIDGNMKSRKPKKSKKSRKIKMNLFQEVRFKPKSAEMAVLVLACVLVFGASFLVSGKILYDHGQKKLKISSSQPETTIMKSAVAAEKNISGTEGDVSSKEFQDPEAAAAELALAKAQANKTVRAKMAARQRAAQTTRILSGPVPTGKTSGMPDGRRVCTTKSLHPQRGGKVHVDEDCCADYNETPNPRCYYPPNKMKILKQ